MPDCKGWGKGCLRLRLAYIASPGVPVRIVCKYCMKLEFSNLVYIVINIVHCGLMSSQRAMIPVLRPGLADDVLHLSSSSADQVTLQSLYNHAANAHAVEFPRLLSCIPQVLLTTSILQELPQDIRRPLKSTGFPPLDVWQCRYWPAECTGEHQIDRPRGAVSAHNLESVITLSVTTTTDSSEYFP